MSPPHPASSASIRTILLSVLFLLGGWGVVAALQHVGESLGQYRQSQSLSKWSSIAVNLLNAAQHLAYERGRSTVVLRAADPISTEDRLFIDERRQLVDEALGSALVNLEDLPEVGYEEINRQWARLVALRRLVDRDAPLARSARDAQFAQRWFDVASELIRTIQLASDELMGRFPPDDKSARLTLFAAAALELRITAGIEASYIAQARSAGVGLRQERLQTILTLRDREDQLWQEIAQLGGYTKMEDLLNKTEEVKGYHLKILRPLQDKVLDELADSGRGLTIPLQQLTYASLPIQDGISALLVQTTAYALRSADEGMVIAWRNLIQQIIWSIFLVVVILFSLKYLLGRVIYPLEQVDDELRRLGALPTATRQGNELDRVLASTEALTQSLAARAEVEEQLRIAHDTLEDQVRLRTAALCASEEKYRVLIESANDAVFLHEIGDDGMPGPFLEVNKPACTQLGYSREELARMTLSDLDDAAEGERIPEAMENLIAQGHAVYEATYMTKDGRSLPVEVSSRVLQLEGKRLLISLVRDITERKLVEQERLRINRFLRILSRCNETLIHAQDEQGLLQAMCQVVVEEGNFASAWIGYVSDHTLSMQAFAGKGGEGYLDEVTGMDIKVETRACELAVRAMQSDEIQVVQETALDSCQFWRERAQACGYLSAISLPLRSGDEVIGALSIYAAEVNCFGEEEVGLLSKLANDLAYGIHALRARIERERFVSQLQGTMESTIQALASTVELRDPYTAGHQRRVAQLAATVSREAGYSEERVQIIYLAGLVHDIGKISVPAEIISKPGALTETEMSLVRSHVEAGYEILQGIEFPWPIANIVHQHHERLDGSGYPKGLKGDEILLEARILSVCDMVEAMITHRPYRPALSIETALAEIQRERDIKLDGTIVDLCVKVFHEQDFVLE